MTWESDDRTVLGRERLDDFAGGVCVGLSIAAILYVAFRVGIALAGGTL